MCGDEDGQFNVLKWWGLVGVKAFSIMTQVAHSILCIPAASAMSENNFSDAGNTLTTKRSNLKPTYVNDYCSTDRTAFGEYEYFYYVIVFYLSILCRISFMSKVEQRMGGSVAAERGRPQQWWFGKWGKVVFFHIEVDFLHSEVVFRAGKWLSLLLCSLSPVQLLLGFSRDLLVFIVIVKF
ncbi:hypothetical protein KFK09_004428 [Dendrobium nobile]|uniref:HAT C-terminal dimerisation domain-containing protein n=1 Tax=Dendrobium nobile TaxID=94219 RepID=A0A8T3C673_DENNO|nr:hypothetical protein KFK09_004428 [Dendrobium nobile]